MMVEGPTRINRKRFRILFVILCIPVVVVIGAIIESTGLSLKQCLLGLASILDWQYPFSSALRLSLYIIIPTLILAIICVTAETFSEEEISREELDL